MFHRTRPHLFDDWSSINWNRVDKHVAKLRGQIYLAKLHGKLETLRFLQKRMINSPCNLISAIRLVTSINRGKRTPGIDKKKDLTRQHCYKLYRELLQVNLLSWVPCPVARVNLPRPSKEPRPLGIPTISDRVVQGVMKNALEPEWEAIFEHGSYGFRPGRACQDAMARLWRVISSKKRTWVLDADIKGCFNNIAHGPLLEKLDEFPAKALIGRWLKAGYFEKSIFVPTELGTPQGGIISPLLANIALHRMEKALSVKYHKNGYIRPECPFVPVRYADDFVVLCNSEEEANRAKAILTKWLEERGMVFSPEKTHIRKLTDGFNFLGWNFRTYTKLGNDKAKGSLRSKSELVSLVRPSSKSIANFKTKVKEIWRKYIGLQAKVLISKLNPILRGWSNYHKHVNSNEVFRKLDQFMYAQAVRYMKKKHHNKSWNWVVARYFKTTAVKRRRKTGAQSTVNSNWSFSDNGAELYLIRSTVLANYSSIAYGKNPYSPVDKQYFAERKSKSIIEKDSSFYVPLC